VGGGAGSIVHGGVQRPQDAGETALNLDLGDAELDGHLPLGHVAVEHDRDQQSVRRGQTLDRSAQVGSRGNNSVALVATISRPAVTPSPGPRAAASGGPGSRRRSTARPLRQT